MYVFIYFNHSRTWWAFPPILLKERHVHEAVHKNLPPKEGGDKSTIKK